MDTSKTHLIKNWSALGRTILSPETIFLILLIASFFVAIFFMGQDVNTLVLMQLTAVLAVLSGLLGGVMMSKQARFRQKELISQRGYAVIHNANLLLSHLYSINKRMGMSVLQYHHNDVNPDLVRSHFDEIKEKCNNLFDDVLNLIGTWQDVIPEANLKNQIRKISNLGIEIAEVLDDLKDLKDINHKLAKGIHEMEQGRVHTSIQQLEKKMDLLEAQLGEAKERLLIDEHLFNYENGKIYLAGYSEEKSVEVYKRLSTSRLLKELEIEEESEEITIKNR